SRIGGTDFVPRALRDNPAAIVAALLYGQEVGLGRMASLSTIAVIDGRPALSSEAQRALILAAGHEGWFEESTATRATACGRRRGSDKVRRVAWTLGDAKRAGLGGRNAWRTYPRQMLMARASAELARAVFPDVIRGLQAAEELDGDGPAESTGTPPPEEKPKRTRRRRKDPAAKPEPEPVPEANPPVAGGGEDEVGEIEGLAGVPDPD